MIFRIKEFIRCKEFKRFTFKFLLIIVVIFLFDFFVGALLNALYFNQKSGNDYKITHFIEKTHAEVLIFGSSKASHHYDPAIIENKLNLSCYNGGRDGQSILYHYAVLQTILKRYKPKKIILDIHFKDLYVEETAYDNLNSLFPYYRKYPEIRHIINLKGPFEKYKFYSRIYPYNSKIFTLITENIKGLIQKPSLNITEYKPLFRTWEEPLSIEKLNETYDSVKIDIFKSFVKACSDNNIDLYIFTSPSYLKFTQKPKFIDTVQQISDIYKVPYYNYLSDHKYLATPGIFYDQYHLNNKGATIFTEEICDIIK